MSSTYVRTQIKNFIAAEAPAEKVIDLTSLFSDMKEVIEENSIGHDDPWLGLEFIGDEELPITIGSTNDKGKYRETGAIYFHIVVVASLGSGDTILSRGDTLRDLMRGRRIGNLVVESVSPINTSSGATLQFEGGYMSGSFIVSYYCDFDL